MRISGSIVADGTTIQLNQGGNSTTISAGSPAGDVTITLPATTSTLATVGGTETLTGKTIDGDDNTVQDLPLTAIKTVLGDADKVLVRDAAGVPSSALIVNANIDAAAAIAVTKLAAVTASRVLVSDGDGKLSASSVTATTLGYLDATSSIQTQINSKQATITGAATSIDDADLTANKVLISDGSGKVAASSVSDTTLGYLDATSSVQAQIDGKQAADSDLTALANLSSTGVVARTGSGTAAVRTITGTTNKITVTDGDGVSGNPTLNIGSDVVTITGVQTLSQKRLDSPQLEEVTVLPRDFTAGDSPFIRFKSGDISSNHVQLEGPTSLASSYAVILPTTAPSTGQNLKAGTSGQLEWGGVEGGNSAGDIVTTDDTQTLTNKTITSPTVATPVIDDYLDINEETAPGTPGSGKVRVYAKTDKKLYKKTSDGIEASIGGSGSGEKNYIANPDDSGSWTASAGGIAVSTETTAGNLPELSKGSAIKFLRASGADYVRYRFTIDEVDKSKALKLAISQRYAGAAGDYTITVHSNTASDYSGSYTDCTVKNNSVPAGNLTWDTQVDTTTADYYEVRVNGIAGTTALYLSGFLVGPGKVVNGFASYDNLPVTMACGFTNTTVSAKETRRGAIATYDVKVTLTGTPVGSLTLTLPSGRTIDTSALPTGANSGNNVMLPGSRLTIEDSGTASYFGGVGYSSTTAVQARVWGAAGTYVSVISSLTPTLPITFTTNDEVYISFSVPIAEWAGGSAYLGSNDEEFASNDGSGGTTAGATYSTGMKNGAGGSDFVGVNSSTTTSATRYKVTFQTPIQATDDIELEIYQNGYWGVGGIGTTQRIFQGASQYGMWWEPIDSTSIYVAFGNMGTRPDNATYAGSGAGWSTWTGGSYKWRVRKVKAGAAIGFGAATATTLGLVKGGTVPGSTAGTVSTGYIGEMPGSTQRAGTGGSAYTVQSTTAWSTSLIAVCSATLNKGVYLVSAVTSFTQNATAQNVLAALAIGGTQVSMATMRVTTSASGEHIVTLPAYPVVITSDSTAVALAMQNTIGTVSGARNELCIIRIA